MNFFEKMFGGKKDILVAEKNEKDESLEPEQLERGRFEHLRADIKPIMTCVGTRADFGDHPGPMVIFENPKSKKVVNNAGHVDYYGNSRELTNKGFRNHGDYSYVISTIDKQDKFSDGFRNCTGLLVAGQDKNTGENISFLSHEDPGYFLSSDGKPHFLIDFRERLEE